MRYEAPNWIRSATNSYLASLRPLDNQILEQARLQVHNLAALVQIARRDGLTILSSSAGQPVHPVDDDREVPALRPVASLDPAAYTQTRRRSPLGRERESGHPILPP